MKTRIISIILLLCILITTIFCSSCSTPTSNNSQETVDAFSSDLDFDLPKAPEQEHAILHMIRPVDELDGWQSGKTEPAAMLYMDDMMKVFDELEWKNDTEGLLISGDFDFRINLYRKESELVEYKEFVKDTETPVFSEDDEDNNISVQYLINYTDKTVNMRLFDYSAEVFDTYAQMNDYQMRVLVLCLKYYFGAQN